MNLSELDRQLEAKQLSGFWNTRVPSQKPEAPYLWKWEALIDSLMKASETIGIDQADDLERCDCEPTQDCVADGFEAPPDRRSESGHCDTL